MSIVSPQRQDRIYCLLSAFKLLNNSVNSYPTKLTSTYHHPILVVSIIHLILRIYSVLSTLSVYHHESLCIILSFHSQCYFIIILVYFSPQATSWQLGLYLFFYFYPQLLPQCLAYRMWSINDGSIKWVTESMPFTTSSCTNRTHLILNF